MAKSRPSLGSRHLRHPFASASQKPLFLRPRVPSRWQSPRLKSVHRAVINPEYFPFSPISMYTGNIPHSYPIFTLRISAQPHAKLAACKISPGQSEFWWSWPLCSLSPQAYCISPSPPLTSRLCRPTSRGTWPWSTSAVSANASVALAFCSLPLDASRHGL